MASASRLVYGYAKGRQHGPRRTALGVAAASGIDRVLGTCGLAQPALLVSGFWRSGTTWLQENLATALGAKTVFEPLAPMDAAARQMLAQRFPDDTEDLRQATVLGPCPFDDAIWTLLGDAATGRLSTPYLLSCRQTVGESLRVRSVVKDVRLQANLAAFHHRFGTPVLHVRRHPCAVVASLLAADWHWSFARVGLATLLPRLGSGLDLVDVDAALGCDTDALSRIAAFWAVTERVAEASLAGTPWGTVLSYEAFAAEPDMAQSAACRRLGLRVSRAVDFTQPSASVHPDAFAAYEAAPAERWRGMLSLAEQDRILAIADTIHPGWRIAGMLAP